MPSFMLFAERYIELATLTDLKEKGLINDEEYERAKEKILK